MSLRYRLAAPWLAVHRLLAPPAGPRLLLLHEVAGTELPALERLVRWLDRTGRLASPPEIEAVLAGSAAATPRIALSFDDGFAGNLAAARVIAAAGARALFFVCPGLIELTGAAQRAAIAANIFDGKRGAGNLRLLDWAELATLKAEGHTIASHTLSHRRLTRLNAAEIAAEIDGAAALLEKRLGAGPDWFAYPFGDIDSLSPEALTIIGRRHRYCRSGVRGAIGPATPPLAIPADQIDLAAPFAYQQLVAEGGLDTRYRTARARLGEMADQATLARNQA